MRPGVDAAQRACQGAAVHRVNRPGDRLPSAAVPPGVAASQLPRLGLPLVFQARNRNTDILVEPSNISQPTANDQQAAGSPTADNQRQPRSNRSPSISSAESQPFMGKVVITLETAATLQRVGEGSSAVSRRYPPRVTQDPCHIQSTADMPEQSK